VGIAFAKMHEVCNRWQLLLDQNIKMLKKSIVQPAVTADFMIIYLETGGQTCALEESLAEQQKRQRAATLVCGVNINMVKNARFT